MEQSKKSTKTGYYQNKEQAEKLFDGYKTFLDGQLTKCNLRLITETECERAIIDYEDRLFYYEFTAWEYEMKEAMREFKKAQKQVAGFDKVGMMIEEINATPPKRKRVNHKKSELISKLYRQLAESRYSSLVSTCKLVPVHLSQRRRFPLPPNN